MTENQSAVHGEEELKIVIVIGIDRKKRKRNKFHSPGAFLEKQNKFAHLAAR